MLDLLISFIQTLYDVPKLISLVGYAGLFLIIFAETGLLIGFILPGDSLLLTAGVFAAAGYLDIWILIPLLFAAAVIGDAFGYYFGKKVGPTLYSKKDTWYFKRKHLRYAQDYYEKHGGKTIVLARFVPLVRTFAPIVAGISKMKYSHFFMYNVVGALLWATGLTLVGYILGNVVPDVEKYILLIIAAIVIISTLPIAIKVTKQKLKEAEQEEKEKN